MLCSSSSCQERTSCRWRGSSEPNSSRRCLSNYYALLSKRLTYFRVWFSITPLSRLPIPQLAPYKNLSHILSYCPHLISSIVSLSLTHTHSLSPPFSATSTTLVLAESPSACINIDHFGTTPGSEVSTSRTLTSPDTLLFDSIPTTRTTYTQLYVHVWSTDLNSPDYSNRPHVSVGVDGRTKQHHHYYSSFLCNIRVRFLKRAPAMPCDTLRMKGLALQLMQQQGLQRELRLDCFRYVLARIAPTRRAHSMRQALSAKAWWVAVGGGAHSKMGKNLLNRHPCSFYCSPSARSVGPFPTQAAPSPTRKPSYAWTPKPRPRPLPHRHHPPLLLGEPAHRTAHLLTRRSATRR